jgi:hypothetical protein
VSVHEDEVPVSVEAAGIVCHADGDGCVVGQVLECVAKLRGVPDLGARSTTSVMGTECRTRSGCGWRHGCTPGQSADPGYKGLG